MSKHDSILVKVIEYVKKITDVAEHNGQRVRLIFADRNHAFKT